MHQQLAALDFRRDLRGEGLIAWPELCKKETNLWDGKGLGASQKAERLGRRKTMGWKTDEMTKIR